jgi:hypothetical protein
MSTIESLYTRSRDTPSDINEHIETLYQYASTARTVLELGTRGGVSSVAFLKGLGDQNAEGRSLTMVDIQDCSSVVDELHEAAFELQHPLKITFLHGDDLDVIPTLDQKFDLVFIDTFHCGIHLIRELELVKEKCLDCIIMHDTTIDGDTSEMVRLGYEEIHYGGMMSKYGCSLDECKLGLKWAIGKFISANPMWQVLMEYTNNNGLTILKRVYFDSFGD